MKFYVARHGQTSWNVLNKVCGRTDIPLTGEGIRQAEALARQVLGLSVSRIISSPMLRARQTAEIAARALGLPYTTDERLIEQDYGIFEGADRQDERFLSHKRQFAVRYPGGESMMDVACRTYRFLDECRSLYPGENLLLVCHGGVARVMRSYFVDMDNETFFRYQQENCGCAIYEAAQLGRAQDCRGNNKVN